MRRPSRLMPHSITTRPASPVGWVLFICLVALLLLALWHRPLPVGGALLFLMLLAAGNWLVARRHLRHLAAARNGEDIGVFARLADCRENDTWVVRAVYEQVQLYLRPEMEAFPLRWSDRFAEDLRIDEEDLEDIIAPEVAERTGRSLALTGSNPFNGRVRTVGDLVRFFNHQPLAPKP